MHLPNCARVLVSLAVSVSGLGALGCSVIGGGPQNDPGVVGARPTGFVYTTLYNKNAVLEINTVQSRVEQEPILVGNGPRGLTMDPRGRQLYLYVVCELGNTVAVIDRRNRLVNRTISVGTRPFAMAIAPTGTRGFVTNTDDDTVSVIDIPTNTVVQTVLLATPETNPGTPPSGGTGGTSPRRLRPKGIATNATGSLVYVACEGGALCILQGNPQSAPPTSGGGGSVGQNATYSVLRTVPLIGAVQPLNIAVATGAQGSGDLIYVTDPRANRIFFLNSQQTNQANVLDVLGSPFDVAVSRNLGGNPDAVFVTLETRDAMQVFSAADMSPRGNSVLVQGRQPQAVEVSSLGTEVYVSLSGSNNVAVFQYQRGALNVPQVFNLQQLNPAFIAPTGDLALGGFLFN